MPYYCRHIRHYMTWVFLQTILKNLSKIVRTFNSPLHLYVIGLATYIIRTIFIDTIQVVYTHLLQWETSSRHYWKRKEESWHQVCTLLFVVNMSHNIIKDTIIKSTTFPIVNLFCCSTTSRSTQRYVYKYMTSPIVILNNNIYIFGYLLFLLRKCKSIRF